MFFLSLLSQNNFLYTNRTELTLDTSVTTKGMTFNSLMDPYPFVYEHRIPTVEVPIDVRCRLPRKISPLYNILTPFNLGGWCIVGGTILVACLGFLAVNAINGHLPKRGPTMIWSVYKPGAWGQTLGQKSLKRMIFKEVDNLHIVLFFQTILPEDLRACAYLLFFI